MYGVKNTLCKKIKLCTGVPKTLLEMYHLQKKSTISSTALLSQ